MISSLCAAALGALTLAGVLAATAAEAQSIVPHRAVYDMRLGRVTGGADISGVEGRMLYVWEDTCDGWRVEQRYQLQFGFGGDRNVEQTSTYATWEAKTGDEFSFSMRNAIAGNQTEEFRGRAVSGRNGVRSEFRIPDETSADLPAGTLFPTAHTVEMIAQAQAGAPYFASPLFDGTDQPGVSTVGAAIGPAIRGADQDDPLRPGPRYPIRMAFFSHTGDAQAVPVQIPDFELAVELHPSGLVERMEIFYEDFSVIGTVAFAEPIPAQCP